MLKLAVDLPRRHFDISMALEIPDCSIYCLYGPSGAGKSSVLSVIAGFEQRYRSIYLQLGEEVLALTPGKTGDGTSWNPHDKIFVPTWQRGIAYLTQSTPLFPHLTVAKNIFYAKPPEVSREQGEELVYRLRLESYLDSKPRQLSGGMMQRVALARALIVKPRVLLLDEPFSALDWNARMELQSLVVELQQRLEMTVVLVTHQLEEAQRMAHRIGVLKDGRLLQQGSPQDLMKNPKTWTVAGLLGYRTRLDAGDCHYALHAERAVVRVLDKQKEDNSGRGRNRAVSQLALTGRVQEVHVRGGRWLAGVRFALAPGWRISRWNAEEAFSTAPAFGEEEAADMEVVLAPDQTVGVGQWVEVRFPGAPVVEV